MTVQALESSTAPAEMPVGESLTTVSRQHVVATTTYTSLPQAQPQWVFVPPIRLVLEGVSQPIEVRLEQEGGVQSIADVATGIFGAGINLSAAVQDFRSALEEHLAVLSAQPELAPDLQYQLDVLRRYFAST